MYVDQVLSLLRIRGDAFLEEVYNNCPGQYNNCPGQ